MLFYVVVLFLALCAASSEQLLFDGEQLQTFDVAKGSFLTSSRAAAAAAAAVAALESQYVDLARPAAWAGRTFFYGGLHQSELYEYDGVRFARVEVQGDAPPRMRDASVLRARSTLFIVADHVAAFDLNTHRWRMLSSPTSFAGAAVALVGGNIWALTAKAELYVYDWQDDEWFEVPPKAGAAAPAARTGASAVAVGHEFLLFGGVLTATGEPAADLWSLHAASVDDEVEWLQARVLDVAIAPAARRDAVLAVDEASEKLYVFGGRDAARVFKDVWSFDLTHLQWTHESCYPGLAMPACREASLELKPPAAVPLRAFHYAAPGVSEATYTVALTSAPTHPVHVEIAVAHDASHVQASPSSLTFDETNWRVPQRVRVLVLEDLMLPDDALRVSLTHAVRSVDAFYERAKTAAPVRRIEIPSVCGDGRCVAGEDAHACPADCRNVADESAQEAATKQHRRRHGAADGDSKRHALFCGDGICHADETHETCAADCGVQGTDNSCPAERAIRCRTGACVATAGACALRARSTTGACHYDDDAECRMAVLACADGELLCPDGTCAADANACAALAPCAAGQRRCFDTSCRVACGDAERRCPPRVRNLLLGASRCVADPPRDAATTTEHLAQLGAYVTTLRQARAQAPPARMFLLANGSAAFYGQLAFPPMARDASACPTCARRAGDGSELMSVLVTPLAAAQTPPHALGGAFCLRFTTVNADEPDDGAAHRFTPALASVWVAHTAPATSLCLARRVAVGDAGDGRYAWRCVDEALTCATVNGDDGDCGDAHSVKHTRGQFVEGDACYAFIRDNCPGVPNPSQADGDGDGVGDACDERGASCGPLDDMNANALYAQRVFQDVLKLTPPPPHFQHPLPRKIQAIEEYVAVLDAEKAAEAEDDQ